MKLIAHRGNINGPDIQNENKPEYIKTAIVLGYDCEIDVRLINNELYLGHDEPTYKINIDFLITNKDSLWIHCKNITALGFLSEYKNYVFNYFWHQTDDYVITSNEFIWTYPKDKYDMFFSSQIILDFSDNVDYNYYREQGIYAVCCDYVNLKEIY